MPSHPPSPAAIVGVAEQANRAVLVTLGPDARLLDRRTLTLTPSGTPTHPHHHEGSWAVGRYLGTPGARAMPLAEAVALVHRVQALAEEGAQAGLEALARQVGAPIGTLTVRTCPELPPTVEQRILDPRAQTYADSVMYRQALVTAARARGWRVLEYDPAQVSPPAVPAAGEVDLAARLQELGRAAGPPWQAPHKLAAAAALRALSRP